MNSIHPPCRKGIHFRSDRERLLAEVDHALTIIWHGLVRFVKDHQPSLTLNNNNNTANKWAPLDTDKSFMISNKTPQRLNFTDIDMESHSSCTGNLSRQVVKKGNILHE